MKAPLTPPPAVMARLDEIRARLEQIANTPVTPQTAKALEREIADTRAMMETLTEDILDESRDG